MAAGKGHGMSGSALPATVGDPFPFPRWSGRHLGWDGFDEPLHPAGGEANLLPCSSRCSGGVPWAAGQDHRPVNDKAVDPPVFVRMPIQRIVYSTAPRNYLRRTGQPETF